MNARMMTTQVAIARVDRLYKDVHRIQGWLWPHACRLMAILDSCQKRHGITGDLFEIGVYHGKSAVILASMLAEQEILGVCDISFATPDGGSQPPKLRRFRQNMQRYFSDPAFLHVFGKSSRELSLDEISRACRIIHIDGGHDSADVYEDLRLADSCLHEKGVIILDDAYVPRWPGVMDGVYRFFYEHRHRLVPLVSGFKKLALVRPSAVAVYAADLSDSPALRERFAGKGPHYYKTESIMEYPTHVYFDAPAATGAPWLRLTVAAYQRLPWLRNPFTLRLKKSLHKATRRAS